jgi:hypothetical protein
VREVLTEMDHKNLWSLFSDTLAQEGLEAGTYRGRFNENVIPTHNYDTNRRVIIDLVKRIASGRETSELDPRPIRIEMPPPKAGHEHTSGQENPRPVCEQQPVDERLYEYVRERYGQDISLNQASKDLRVAREEIDKAVDRLRKAGRLELASQPSSSNSLATEQTQRCIHCFSETALGSKFCAVCGQPQDIGVSTSFSHQPGETEMLLPDHITIPEVRSEDQRTEPGVEGQRRTPDRKREESVFRFRIPTIGPKPTQDRTRQTGGRPPITGGTRSESWGKPPPAKGRPVTGLRLGRSMSCPRCSHLTLRWTGKRWYCDKCASYIS